MRTAVRFHAGQSDNCMPYDLYKARDMVPR